MSDRTNMAILDAARVASNPDIASPGPTSPTSVTAQRDQRWYAVTTFAPGASAINVQINYLFNCIRFDRAVKITDARLITTANVASNATNYSVVTLYAAGDNVVTTSGSVVGTVNTANSAITSYISQAFTLNQANVTLAANTTIAFATAQNGGANAPSTLSNTVLQVQWQEV